MSPLKTDGAFLKQELQNCISKQEESLSSCTTQEEKEMQLPNMLSCFEMAAYCKQELTKGYTEFMLAVKNHRFNLHFCLKSK